MGYNSAMVSSSEAGKNFLISAGVAVVTMLGTAAFCIWAPDKYAEWKAALSDSLVSLGVLAGGLTFMTLAVIGRVGVE